MIRRFRKAAAGAGLIATVGLAGAAAAAPSLATAVNSAPTAAVAASTAGASPNMYYG